MIMRSGVVMIAEDDIEQLVGMWLQVPEWIKAHISTNSPLHRFIGELTLEKDMLIFRGRDIKDNCNYRLEIPIPAMTRVSFGFSSQLKSKIDPAFGAGGSVPFVLTYKTNGTEHSIYFNTTFNRFIVDREHHNREWFDILSDIVNTRQSPRDRLLASLK